MSHSPNIPLSPQHEPYDDPEPGSTWFVTIAGVIVLVALVVGISAITFNTESHELQVKVFDRSSGVLPVIPSAPLDAASARQIARELEQRWEQGMIAPGDYARLSQGLLLNSWARYPWEDARGQTRQLIRIPITEAMRIVAREYAPARSGSVAVAPAAAVDAGDPVGGGNATP